jgi:hypothetical protein
MDNMQKNILLNLLAVLHKEEKEKAKDKGSHPKDKIVEEACEVLSAHLTTPFFTPGTEQEEMDLLWCLIDKYMDHPTLIQKFREKLLSRGFEPTEPQCRFIIARAWILNGEF